MGRAFSYQQLAGKLAALVCILDAAALTGDEHDRRTHLPYTVKNSAILHRRLIFHLLFRQVGRDNSRQLCAAASVNDCKNLFGCLANLTLDTEIIDHNGLVISEAVKKPLPVIAVLQQIQEAWKAGDRGRNVLL